MLGRNTAAWESFKTAKGVLSDTVTAEQIQKIADKFFPIFKEKKTECRSKIVQHFY